MKLTAAKRRGLSTSSFAEPETRSYPIEDKNHAKAALSMVSRYGTPAEQSKVRGAVAKKYGMGRGILSK